MSAPPAAPVPVHKMISWSAATSAAVFLTPSPTASAYFVAPTFRRWAVPLPTADAAPAMPPAKSSRFLISVKHSSFPSVPAIRFNMTTTQIQRPPVSPVPKPGCEGDSLYTTPEGRSLSLLRNSSSERSTADKMKSRIKILLADDHPVVRRGIASCLARHENLVILGEAADGREALRKAKELAPDIILMDIDMPHMNGLTVTETLRRELPHIKVLILSMHSNTEYVLRIIQSGARGYVLKGAAPEELVKAIQTVNGGEAFF